MEEAKVVTIGRKLTIGEEKRFRTTGCPELELASQGSQQTTGTMHVCLLGPQLGAMLIRRMESLSKLGELS